MSAHTCGNCGMRTARVGECGCYTPTEMPKQELRSETAKLRAVLPNQPGVMPRCAECGEACPAHARTCSKFEDGDPPRCACGAWGASAHSRTCPKFETPKPVVTEVPNPAPAPMGKLLSIDGGKKDAPKSKFIDAEGNAWFRQQMMQLLANPDIDFSKAILVLPAHTQLVRQPIPAEAIGYLEWAKSACLAAMLGQVQTSPPKK